MRIDVAPEGSISHVSFALFLPSVTPSTHLTSHSTDVSSAVTFEADARATGSPTSVAHTPHSTL